MRAWRKSGGNRHRKRAQILFCDVPDELNHLLRESKPRNRRLGPFQLRSRESEFLLRDLAQAHDEPQRGARADRNGDGVTDFHLRGCGIREDRMEPAGLRIESHVGDFQGSIVAFRSHRK